MGPQAHPSAAAESEQARDFDSPKRDFCGTVSVPSQQAKDRAPTQ